MGNLLTNGRGWTRREKLACRRLYLTEGLSPKEIAEKLDKSDSAIHCFVSRNGWAKQRREAEIAAAREGEEKAAGAAKDFVESVAGQSQELAEVGFELARSAAAAKDAKEFAFAANGTKAFVHLARAAMGLDGAAAKQQGAALSLNVILARPVAGEPIKVQAVSESAESLEFE